MKESQSSDSNLIDQQTEKSQLSSDLIYEDLKNILPISSQASSEEIISYINDLIKNNNSYKEKENILTKDLESVNQQLINVYHQCEQLEEYNKQLLLERQPITDEIQQDYILLKNQYTQLDNANRSWQQFYENQIDLIKNQFKDYIDFGQNLDFNQIIQTIATEFQQKNNPSGKSSEYN